MGYSDDLVARLRQDGMWDQLTVEQQDRFAGLSDEQARQILVMDDQWEMSEQGAVEVFGLMSLVRMIRSFRGALVELHGENAGKLSKAGRLLAEFFMELRQRGLSAEEIDEDLRKMTPLVIAALIAAYQGTPD
jgi:hypothetical protein